MNAFKTQIQRGFTLLTTLGIFAAPSLSANDLDPLGMYGSSLNDLLNLKVVTVSKKPEAVTDAPGVIHVVSADEIKTFGARNIRDVLQRVTSMYISDSATFMGTGLNLRAGATQHLNNHVLYLLNGRPMRESQNGGLHTDINLFFPVENLEKIEIIRGPGSVLYGSNAYSGTINFITQKPLDGEKVSVQTSYGSKDHLRSSLTAGLQFNNGGSAMISASRMDEDGASMKAIDEQGLAGERTLPKDGKTVFVMLAKGGFSFHGLQSEVDVPMFTGSFRWNNDATFKQTRRFYDLSYEHDFNDDWNLRASYTYNENNRLIEQNGATNSSFRSNGYLYELTLSGQVTPELSLVGGGVYDITRGDLGIRGGSYRAHRDSLYLQGDYRLKSWAKIVAGLEWNSPDNSESELSKRLGLVHWMGSHWSSKWLYSEAFRSPYGSELFFKAPFLNGDAQLKPEKMDTYEAQLNYSQTHYNLSLTYYHSRARQAIARKKINNVNTFYNVPETVTFNGLELEAKWDISIQWKLQGSASIQENESSDGYKPFMSAPKSMIKWGSSYMLEEGITIGLWDSYFAAISKKEDVVNGIAVVNPPAKAVHLLSLNLHFDLSMLLDRFGERNVEASIYAHNLLDEELYYPELGGRPINTYPQAYARSIVGTLRVDF